MFSKALIADQRPFLISNLDRRQSRTGRAVAFDYSDRLQEIRFKI
jgi:hypothetical protein